MNPDQNSSNLPTSHKRLIRGLVASAVIIAVVAAILLAIHYHHTTPTAATPPRKATIQITSNGFIPATLSIKLGTEVVWKNTDMAAHVIASNPYPADNSLPGLHSGQTVPGGTYVYIPTSAGTISYHDNTSPTHNGTIVVTK